MRPDLDRCAAAGLARADSRSLRSAAVEKAHASIKERYPDARSLPVKCDVGKEADVKAAVEAAVAAFGRLDVMVSHLRMTSLSIGVEAEDLVSRTVQRRSAVPASLRTVATSR